MTKNKLKVYSKKNLAAKELLFGSILNNITYKILLIIFTIQILSKDFIKEHSYTDDELMRSRHVNGWEAPLMLGSEDHRGLLLGGHFVCHIVKTPGEILSFACSFSSH